MWNLIRNLNKQYANFSTKLPQIKYLYQHILPNPPGYEAIDINQIQIKHPSIKTEIVDCPQTYIMNASVTIPKDLQSCVEITYLHSTTLGHLHVHIYHPIKKIYSIKNEQVTELNFSSINKTTH